MTGLTEFTDQYFWIHLDLKTFSGICRWVHPEGFWLVEMQLKILVFMLCICCGYIAKVSVPSHNKWYFDCYIALNVPMSPYVYYIRLKKHYLMILADHHQVHTCKITNILCFCWKYDIYVSKSIWFLRMWVFSVLGVYVLWLFSCGPNFLFVACMGSGR